MASELDRLDRLISEANSLEEAVAILNDWYEGRDVPFIPSILDKISTTVTEIEQGTSGDMLKSVYDTNNDGVVDNAKQLDGQTASTYDQSSHVSDISVHLSTNERASLDNSPTAPTGANPLATQADVVAAGGGDMFKSVYDIGDNGKVDVAELAESADYNNLTNVPTTFTPVSHTHINSEITDIDNLLTLSQSASPNTLLFDKTGGYRIGSKGSPVTFASFILDVTGALEGGWNYIYYQGVTLPSFTGDVSRTVSYLNEEAFTANKELKLAIYLIDVNNYEVQVVDSIDVISTVKPLETLTYASTIEWDAKIFPNAVVTLTGNTILNINNMDAGNKAELIIIQDNTGSRLMTFPTGYYNEVTPTLTTTADARDTLNVRWTGSAFDNTLVKDQKFFDSSPLNTYIANVVIYADANIITKPSGAYLTALSNFFDEVEAYDTGSLLTNGYWLSVYALDGTANEFSTLNLLNTSTNNATETGTMSFTAKKGFRGVTNGYLDRGWIPNSGADNVMFSHYLLDRSGSNAWQNFGRRTGGAYLFANPISPNAGGIEFTWSVYGGGTANYGDSTEANADKLFTYLRSDVNTSKVYVNTIQKAINSSSPIGGKPVSSYWELAYDNAGSPHYDTFITLGFSYAGPTDESGITVLNTAWQNYLTEISGI